MSEKMKNFSPTDFFHPPQFFSKALENGGWKTETRSTCRHTGDWAAFPLVQPIRKSYKLFVINTNIFENSEKISRSKKNQISHIVMINVLIKREQKVRSM